MSGNQHMDERPRSRRGRWLLTATMSSVLFSGIGLVAAGTASVGMTAARSGHAVTVVAHGSGSARNGRVWHKRDSRGSAVRASTEARNGGAWNGGAWN